MKRGFRCLNVENVHYTLPTAGIMALSVTEKMILSLSLIHIWTIRYLNDHFSGCSFAGGFYDHSTATAVWELADETLVQSYQNALEQHDVPYGPLKPAIRLSTSCLLYTSRSGIS